MPSQNALSGQEPEAAASTAAWTKRLRHSPRCKLNTFAPKHHGGDELENLALACIDCNLHKGSNLAGIDPLSSQLTELFHPRQHVWEDHFEIIQGRIRGKTAIGRVTVDVMNFNSEEQVLLRLAKG